MCNESQDNGVSVPPATRDKVYQFVMRLVDAPAQNLVGIADDWLRYFRYSNLLAIHDKVEALHARRLKDGKTTPLPPKYAVPLMEASSLEDTEELRDVWARLIANATDPSYHEQYHPSYVDVVKQLSPDEAKLVQHFATFENYPVLFDETTRTRADWASSRAARGDSPLLESYRTYVATLELKYPERSMAYLNNLERIKLIEIARDFSQELKDSHMAQVGRMNDIDGVGGLGGDLSDQLELEYRWNEELRFTAFGQGIAELCFDGSTI